MTGLSTTRGPTLALLALLIGFVAPVRASEEEKLEFRGEATAGVRLYVTDDPYDSGDLTSFFDQYLTIRDKDDVSAFGSLLHLDVGAYREDDTSLVRFEWWNPHALNERAEFDLDLDTTRFEIDYHRFRTNDLRVYPVGTDPDGLLGLAPVFGTVFNPDQGPGNPLGIGSPLYQRRTGITGDLRHRLEPSAIGKWLPQLRLYGGAEWRRGWNQDRFVLDDVKEFASPRTARFRANRRKSDQIVSHAGAGLVLGSGPNFTSALDFKFEALREDANEVTLATLASRDPRIMPFNPQQSARGFRYVPDTNRYEGTLRAAGRLGPMRMNGTAFVSHLEQTGTRSTLQEMTRAGKTGTTTFSTHTAFDMPIAKTWSVGGFVKYLYRHNDLERSAFDKINPPDGQVDPFLRRRQEVTGEFEVNARPRPGLRFFGGYRARYVDRDLKFSNAPNTIDPSLNLQGDKSQEHTGYVGARARLFRRTQLTGEAGYTHAPDVSLPRDFENSWYAEGRVSQQFPGRFPANVSLFGKITQGESEDIDLLNSGSADDTTNFERMRWNTGVNASVMLTQRTSLFGSVVVTGDDQRFAHLRSNLPRFFGPGSVNIYIDSKPEYESTVYSFVLGGEQEITQDLQLSVVSTYTWARIQYDNGGNTGRQLDAINEVNDRIFSLDTNLHYQWIQEIGVDLGYRFDDFNAKDLGGPIKRDTHFHTVSLSFTINLNALTERFAGASI